MKSTAYESALLKGALKHEPLTPVLEAEAEAFPLEAGEAYEECRTGADSAAEGSWAARELRS